MSRLASANLHTEIRIVEPDNRQNPRPVLVHTRRENMADCVTRRVIEAVDAQLANGSMPA